MTDFLKRPEGGKVVSKKRPIRSYGTENSNLSSSAGESVLTSATPRNRVVSLMVV